MLCDCAVLLWSGCAAMMSCRVGMFKRYIGVKYYPDVLLRCCVRMLC